MRNIETQWHHFLKEILENGVEHTKDDGDKLKESLVNHCMITNPLGFNNNISSKKFLELVKDGAFDIKDYPLNGEALYNYVSSLDNSEQIYLDKKDGFIYTYPERLQNIMLVNRENIIGYHNQFGIMLTRLKKSKGSNRAVATLYSAGLDKNEQDIPCLNWLQATIRDNKLLLHVMFRSNDCYGAFPSNMLFLSYLGLRLVEELYDTYPSLVFEGINYNSTSLHIYEPDIPQAKKILDQLE